MSDNPKPLTTMTPAEIRAQLAAWRDEIASAKCSKCRAGHLAQKIQAAEGQLARLEANAGS